MELSVSAPNYMLWWTLSSLCAAARRKQSGADGSGGGSGRGGGMKMSKHKVLESPYIEMEPKKGVVEVDENPAYQSMEAAIYN